MGIEKVLKNVANYTNVGIIPNSMAALLTLDLISSFSNNDLERLPGAIFATAFTYLVGAVKFKEYKKIKNALEEHGWDERIVEPKMYSWCQRYAAKQAAKQLGYETEFNRFLEEEGHKWYHFLPKSSRSN